MSLLEVKNLKVHFPVKPGMFSRVHEFVKAVDDVSFAIEPGETFGLVGESGCGKTTLGRAIVRLVEPTAGSVLLNGEDITGMGGSALRARRRKFQMIFQDPYGSLNPRMTVEQIVGDMADRVAVMYAGQIVELSPAKELLRRPWHPYTRALMASVPKLHGDASRLSAIPGNVPRIGNFPPGCRFAPRCPMAKPECSKAIPELVEVEAGRWVRCPFWK